MDQAMENSGIFEADMPSKMYEYYLAGSNSSSDDSTTTAAVAKRVDTYYWQACSDNVLGRCGSDYGVGWNGGLRTFMTYERNLLQRTQNGRSGRNPRGICSGFNQGTICVSWAANYKTNLAAYQIEDIVKYCSQACEEQGQSCLAKATSYGEPETFCVSNRGDGCNVDESLSQCS